MRWRVRYSPQLYRRVVSALQQGAEETFTLSQVYVPVDRGALKKSGTLELTSTGAIIAYRTSYAAKMESGLPPGATVEVPRHTIKAHRRRGHSVTRRGRTVLIPATRVERHERGPFTKTYHQGFRGRFYLGRAWDEVRLRLKWFLAEQLRDAG